SSNRQILDLSERYKVIKPALGIYPIDAVNKLLPDNFPIQVNQFSVDDEISYISKQAQAGTIIAVGECGLDGHWVGEETYTEQERVFESLISVAMTYDLPLIIHTRKREQRASEILAHYGVTKVN